MAVPIVTGGASDAGGVTMVSDGGWTSIVKFCAALGRKPLLAPIVPANAPTVVGVPEMCKLTGEKVSPGGNPDAVTTIGAVPDTVTSKL